MFERFHSVAAGSKIVSRSFAAALLLCAAFSIQAQAPSTVAQPLRDPWVPPELRKPSSAAPAEGAELRAQVERKLKSSFDAAAGSSGTLTRSQAAAAGLGLIANHFDEIDRRKAGTVRFEDVKAFLRQRGAQID